MLLLLIIIIIIVELIYVLCSNCSSNDVLLKQLDNITDNVWESYIKEVYGSLVDINKFDYNHFQSIYIMSDINVITDWKYHPIKEIYMQHFIQKKSGPGIYDWSNGYQSYSWVEVTRSRECTHIYMNFQEGLSTGLKYSKDDLKYNDTIPYGCWFFVMRGTGVYVNVGKTMIAYDRSDVNKAFGLFCNRPPYCDGQGDRYWCQKALSYGYDSIQVVNANENENHELVICSGKCSTQPVDENCPPMELRTGYNASDLCNCVENTPIINCNTNITTNICDFTVLREKQGRNHDEYWDCNMLNHKYKRKTCALTKSIINNTNNNYEIKIIVTTSIHEYYYPKVSSIYNKLKLETPNTIMLDLGNLEFGSQLIHHIGPKSMIDLMKIVGYSLLFINTNNYELEKLIGNKLIVISNIPGNVVSTTINTTDSSNLSGIIIGIIAYGHIDAYNTAEHMDQLINQIKDEALCLKKKANIILLLSHGGAVIGIILLSHYYHFYNYYYLVLDNIIRDNTIGYIDIIIGRTVQDTNSCQGALQFIIIIIIIIIIYYYLKKITGMLITLL